MKAHEELQFVLVLGAVIAVPLAVLLVTWGCTRWVLGPLERAGRHRPFSMQFSLADLLCLFVVLQFPLGIMHWVMRGRRVDETVLAVDLAVAVVAAIVWWSGVRTLSRAGIRAPWHRCAMLTLVMPVTLVGSIAVVVLLVASASALANYENSPGYWLLVAEVPLGGALYLLGRLTRAIVAAAEAPRLKPGSLPRGEGTLSRPDVLRVNRSGNGHVVGAGDDGAGVGKDG